MSIDIGMCNVTRINADMIYMKHLHCSFYGDDDGDWDKLRRVLMISFRNLMMMIGDDQMVEEVVDGINNSKGD